MHIRDEWFQADDDDAWMQEAELDDPFLSSNPYTGKEDLEMEELMRRMEDPSLATAKDSGVPFQAEDSGVPNQAEKNEKRKKLSTKSYGATSKKMKVPIVDVLRNTSPLQAADLRHLPDPFEASLHSNEEEEVALLEAAERASQEQRDTEHTNMTLSEFELQGKVVKSGIIALQDLITAQNLDRKLGKVIEQIEDKTYAGTQFKLVDNVLVRLSADNKQKICLPDSLLKLIFVSQHCTDLGFHRSAGQIAMTLGQAYYAENMLQKMRQFAQECYYCLANKSNNAPKHTIDSSLAAKAPRQLWSFDVLGGLPETRPQDGSDQKKLIHIFVENYTLWTVLVAASQKSATAILDSIKEHIIAPYTLPVAIRSDMERGLVAAQVSKEFAASHGIQLISTAPGCSFSNSLVESRIKVCKGMIRAMAASEQGQHVWDQKLHLLACSLNQTVGRSGYSSEQLMFGFTNQRPNDVLNIQAIPRTEEEHLKFIQANLEKMFEQVQIQRDKARESNNAFANAHRKKRNFEVGSLVFLQNDIIKGNSAMTCRFRGPYVVTRISDHSETATVEEQGAGKKLPIKAHFSKMKPITETATLPKLNSNWDEGLRAAFPVQPDRETAL